MTTRIISEMIEVAKVARIRSCSPAPNSWEIMICTPMVIPISTDIARNIAGNAAPTAASALAPTNCPTMMESTALYICWNTLAKIIGTENKSTSFNRIALCHILHWTFTYPFLRFYAAIPISPLSNTKRLIRLNLPAAARLFWQNKSKSCRSLTEVPAGKPVW